MEEYFEGNPYVNDASKILNLLSLVETETTAAVTDPFGKWYEDFLSERVIIRAPESRSEDQFPAQFSAHPSHFTRNLYISKFDTNVTIHEFKERRSIFVYRTGEIKVKSTQEARKSYFIEGPPDEAWTVWAWLSKSYPGVEREAVRELSMLEKDIDNLLSNLRKCKPLPRSAQLLNYGEKVVSQTSQRKQEDIREWAERLANHLSKEED